MKNNSNVKFWVIVIIIAVVAGFIGSYAGGVTGNVVSIQNNGYGKCITDCQKSCLKLSLKDRPECRSKCTKTCSINEEVYTKAEVDALMQNIPTNQGVLDMLSKNCYKISPRADLNNQCDETCRAGFSIGKDSSAKGTAIGSFSGIFYTASKQDGQRDLEFSTTFDFGGITQPMPNCGFDSANDCSQHREEFMELENGYNSTTTKIEIIGVDSKCICCVA